MNNEMKFKEIIARYCEYSAQDIKDEMSFREDLGFSSLDFMSFLGELEDTFDIELEEEHALKIFTVGEALELLESLAS